MMSQQARHLGGILVNHHGRWAAAESRVIGSRVGGRSRRTCSGTRRLPPGAPHGKDPYRGAKTDASLGNTLTIVETSCDLTRLCRCAVVATDLTTIVWTGTETIPACPRVMFEWELRKWRTRHRCRLDGSLVVQRDAIGPRCESEITDSRRWTHDHENSKKGGPERSVLRIAKINAEASSAVSA